MKHFTRPSRHLQSRLTFSYTLTSLLLFLLVEIVVSVLAIVTSSLNIPSFLANIPQQEAPQAVPYFIHGTPDRAMLASWLQIVRATVPDRQGPFKFAQPSTITVVDPQGRVLASSGTPAIPPDTLLQTQLAPQNRASLQAILRGADHSGSVVGTDRDETLVAMAAIVDARGKVAGVFVIKVAAPSSLRLIAEFLQFAALSMSIVTIYVGVSGLISGYLTARVLTRRLTSLSTITERWGNGDLSVLAGDASDDELGQMARQLNHMAGQLRNLLSTRQKLATLEERNRLARELHDSVKQQVFAIAMQIGATRSLFRRDPSAAENHLWEAQKLAGLARQELTALINELRPVALAGRELATALYELATQWTRQNGIVVTTHTEEGPEILPFAVEEALFRVAQEALSNVARHSQATQVQLELAGNDDIVTLTISDNGQGFDPSQSSNSGLGLHFMRERIKYLRGDLQIVSKIEQGTDIIAQLPISRHADNDRSI